MLLEPAVTWTEETAQRKAMPVQAKVNVDSQQGRSQHNTAPRDIQKLMPRGAARE